MKVVDLAKLDDPRRVKALRSMNLLDQPAPPNLVRLVRLACDLVEAPIGLLTLVDLDRQFFLAAHGLPDPIGSARQTGLDYSICQYAVASGRPLIVGDTRADPVLAANPAVAELGVAAYAGIPLLDAHGRAFGTFCVIDLEARDWDDGQLSTLALLAQMANDVCLQAQEGGPGVRPHFGR